MYLLFKEDSNFFSYCYYQEYSDYCHTHNILADMSFGLLQVFHVELENPYRTHN